MSGVSEETHAAAVIAVLNGGRPVGATWQAYDLDELDRMATKPVRYIEVTVTRQYVGQGQRTSGDKGVDGWRVITRYVAETLTNARVLRTHTRARLELARIDIVGDTAIVQYETGEVLALDDEKFWSGLDSWTYAH